MYNKKELYALPNTRGAWQYYGENKDSDSKTDAPHLFRLIGSYPSLIFRMADNAAMPYTGEAAYIFPLYPDTESLAQEAVTTYKLDPARVQRAAEIVEGSRTNCQPAHRDENGEPINTPSYEIQAVKSQNANNSGWYLVRRGSCTCHDSREDGNICKHRIAAWMTRELAERPARIACEHGAQWAINEKNMKHAVEMAQA